MPSGQMAILLSQHLLVFATHINIHTAGFRDCENKHHLSHEHVGEADSFRVWVCSSAGRRSNEVLVGERSSLGARHVAADVAADSVTGVGTLSDGVRGTRATLGLLAPWINNIENICNSGLLSLVHLIQHASKRRFSKYLDNCTAHLMGWHFKNKPSRLYLCAAGCWHYLRVESWVLESWGLGVLGSCGDVEFSGPRMKS